MSTVSSEHVSSKHVLFNALREAVTAREEVYEPWKDALNSLLHLIGDPEHKARFLATCMPTALKSEVDAMKMVNRKYLRWKWEFVEDVLFFVILAHPRYKK